ncbi:terminase gpA endonuclease subunit [uncultured Flavonifractor sp.]|uniref:terminase gpA endonuclease subunit n=1 Tax=uncultured Flavonifractor sp. TaxID=1193534 RepID=UPI0026322FE8|nr:terminase gpA endonuclease subunit [uncultured Flavonifractor sp.]
MKQAYQAPAWIYQALQVLRPRPRLTVSQWAQAKRRVTSGAIPGPWNNSVTPYLVGIMDAFSQETVEEIVFAKPTQVGGTAAMENMIGSLVDQDPAPTLVVYPSDDLAEATAETRLIPMFKSHPDMAGKFREHESKKLQLSFRDMWLYLTGANSPADLSSKPIKNLFLDEVDKYPGATKKEADPISLAKERTKTFFNRKIFMASTPTLRTGYIWREKEAAEVEYHYFVPCPHCGTLIELKFAQLKWPDKEQVPDPAQRAERAVYVCQACGSVLTDRDKGPMLQAGRWQPVRGTSKRPRSVAFWLNTLYSPFTPFVEIVREFLRSKDDPDLLHNFVNSWLAEPWEDTKLKTSAELVLERQTGLPEWALPQWTKLVTGGIDVQENCLYWTIRAWGSGMTSQNVAHGQALSMAEVERIMNLPLYLPDGQQRVVNLALMDSGDQTDQVYEFCLRNADWALPCKGTAAMLSDYRLSTVNKAGSKAYGMKLVLVDGGKYKDLIAARMRRQNGTGAWMVYQGCDLEYAQQVTAEHKVTQRTGSREVQRWVLKTSHGDNHYLDCEVYAAAAADVLGVRTLFLEEERVAEQAPARGSVQKVTQEEAWIQARENWL